MQNSPKEGFQVNIKALFTPFRFNRGWFEATII